MNTNEYNRLYYQRNKVRINEKRLKTYKSGYSTLGYQSWVNRKIMLTKQSIPKLLKLKEKYLERAQQIDEIIIIKNIRLETGKMKVFKEEIKQWKEQHNEKVN